MNYSEFLKTKESQNQKAGFKPLWIPDFLFDFQKALVDWTVWKGQGAIFADCGLGKSVMEMVWAENVVRKTKGCVLLLTPLAVGTQMIEEAKKFGIEGVKRSRDGQLKSRIVVANYERLHYFKPGDFSGIICDECFPPDTKISVFNLDKSLTSKYIRDIRVGDPIYNVCGEDYVKGTAKRRVKRAIRLEVRGRKVTCSENHPFLTVYGWRPAKDIRSGDYLLETGSAMCLLRGVIPSAIRSQQMAKILQHVLLSEMEDASTRNSSKSSLSRSGKETRPISLQMEKQQPSQGNKRKKAFCKTESNGESCFSSKDDRNKDSKWDTTPVEREKRRERTIYKTPTNSLPGSRKRLAFRISCANRVQSNIPNSIQGGYSKQEKKDSNRNRWFWSCQQKETDKGPKETMLPGIVRVDSVEILEQGHPDLEKYREADGFVYFYDLQATRHPSYTVEGLCVHNSGILKNFDGATKNAINLFARKIQYRLLATATPAPNDFIELGTSSEALGYLGYMDMLGRFFKNDQNNCATSTRGRFKEATKWRLKGHAHQSFWRWVTSWSRSIRKPSDMGFTDGKFLLPKLYEVDHELDIARKKPKTLFTFPAQGLKEVRDERKATIRERCEKIAELVSHTKDFAFVGCNLNVEGDLLERLIPDAIQVSGKDSDDSKEEKLTAFAKRQARVLITKPKIGAWGLNFQHCNHVTYFPNYSYEQYYQWMRRCWRFGQKRPVTVDRVYTRGDRNSMRNLQRKSQQADEMFSSIVREMNNSLSIQNSTKFETDMEIPQWA